MKLSTIRKGIIGQELVKADMLRKNLDIYEPVCDDKTIDLLCLIKGAPITIQVKNHKFMNTKSSIAIRVAPTKADVIAVPYKDEVFYIRNRKKGRQWGLSLAVKTPRNNQKLKVRFAKDYKEFPYV